MLTDDDADALLVGSASEIRPSILRNHLVSDVDITTVINNAILWLNGSLPSKEAIVSLPISETSTANSHVLNQTQVINLLIYDIRVCF